MIWPCLDRGTSWEEGVLIRPAPSVGTNEPGLPIEKGAMQVQWTLQGYVHCTSLWEPEMGRITSTDNTCPKRCAANAEVPSGS